jgi:hypothetical protein
MADHRIGKLQRPRGVLHQGATTVQRENMAGCFEVCSADDWGLIQLNDFSMLLLEPYTYAVKLVDECFRQIDEIARLTKVTPLLPADLDMTQLQDNEPSN